MFWRKGWRIARGLVFLGGLMLPAANLLALESGKTLDEPTKTYQSPNGAYTLDIPADWELTWSNAPNDRFPSELQLVAPDAPWPKHVTINVFHYASAYRTAERYLFDLQNPAFGGKDEDRSPATDMLVTGRPAKALDVSSNRYPLPGMTGETVPAYTRTIVMPASQGFFVFRYDVPTRSAATYRDLFDRMVASFAPTTLGAGEAQEQISDSEYAVYTAFFKAKPPKVEEPAQLFDSTTDCRLVSGETLVLDKPVPPDWQDAGFDALDSSLIQDYLAKNQQAWQLTDRIMVPNLVVISPEELATRFSAERQSQEGGGEESFFISGGLVSLSRVGFNAPADTALLDVAISYPRSMRARYLVLMEKQEGTWIIAKVALESFIYH